MHDEAAVTDRRLPEFLADDVVQVTFADGVFRIFFTQSQGEDGRNRPVFRLLIPVSQLPGIVAGLESSVKEIAEKIRAQAAERSPPEQGEAPDAKPTPGETAENLEVKDDGGEKEKSLWRKIKDRVQSPKGETD